jgi:hypothetical protein
MISIIIISSSIIIITMIVILSIFMIIMIMIIKYFIIIIIIMIYPMLLNFLGISAIIPARARLCSCHWQSPRICGIFSTKRKLVAVPGSGVFGELPLRKLQVSGCRM